MWMVLFRIFRTVVFSMKSHSVVQLITSAVLAAIVGALAAFVFMSMHGVFVDSAAQPVTIDSVQVQQGIETLRDEEAATISVVQSVSPAVVSIGIYEQQRTVFNSTGLSPFGDFFFDAPLVPENTIGESSRVKVGGGTGFIIGADGLILTNRHVVDSDSAEYRVVLPDNRELVAQVLAKDPIHDIALIKIAATELPIVSLGDSDAITIGQTVIAIGNALAEFENTVTRGIVSGVNRRVFAGNGRGSSEVIEEAIQTDAAINSGNSGGPLINLSGEVIGVNTAVSNQGQSIGFATPINVAKRAIKSVEKYGRIVRPWLGVRYIMVTPEVVQQNALSEDAGALIVAGTAGQDAVLPDSPAAVAGLQDGDMITHVNDKAVTMETPLASVLSHFFPDDQVMLRVVRADKVLEISVTLGEFEPE